MNTLRMARDYLKRATRCLHEAGGAFNDQDYPMVVRRAQECVELSLKAALRLLGIEYPREHDVSQILLSVQDRLPKWFNAEKYADHSRVLVSKRGPAMYGHEELLTPASEIFGVKDAEEALKMAREVHEACVRLIHEFERLSPHA